MYNRIYVLRFPKEIVEQPIISKLIRNYDTDINILKATILPQHEGVMVLELKGNKANVNEGVAFLKDLGVEVESVSTSIRRDDEKCFQCGACTGICPTGALFLRRPDMAVLFDPEKCSGCGFCVTVCPVRAMEVLLDRSGTLPD